MRSSDVLPQSTRVSEPQPGAGTIVLAVIAKLRVALGFTCGAFVLWLSDPTPQTIMAGAPIALCGELVRIWAAGHLNKSREVTASGPYRWMSHPLYVGSTLMGIGLAVAAGDLFVALMIVLYLVVVLTAAIKSEEAHLRRIFGDQYDLYRQTGRVDTQRRFSFDRAMENREYRAIIGLALAVLLLTWKATYNGSFWGTAGDSFFRPGG